MTTVGPVGPVGLAGPADSTGPSDSAGPDRTVVAAVPACGGGDGWPAPDGGWLGGLAGRVLDLGDAPTELLQRTLMAVAVLHEPDERGRCPACRPRWQLPGRRGGCTTRGLLWLAVTEAATAHGRRT